MSSEPPTITLSIDGRTVNVPKGTTIYNAARRLEIEIPIFCYHDRMPPLGACRMCLVQVERAPKLQTSCTLEAAEGMVVRTATPEVIAGQEAILEYLLINHPLDCPICDKGGECPLQELTMAYGSPESRFLFDDKQRLPKHVPLGDLIWLDRERCIQCARCIRFQYEIVGDSVLEFYKRGRATDIVTFSEPGFDSIFSGNTTDICPVGALTTSDFRFGARPWEMDSTASLCTQCAVGCNTVLNTRREAMSDGRIVIKRIMPRQNEKVNEIWLCDKGRFAHHFTSSESRLGKPLIRKNGKLEETSWEIATASAGEGIKAGGKDLLVLAGGKLANEDLFNLKSLADQMGGTALLYSNMGGGQLTTQMGVGSEHNFGEVGSETCILVASADLYQEAPIWYLRIKQAAERGAKLIVAAGRETKLEKYASHVIRYAYGDETAVIGSLESTPAGKAAMEAIQSTSNLIVLYGNDGLGLDGSTSLAVSCAALIKKSGHEGGLIGVWSHANDQGAWELGYEAANDLAAVFKDKVVYLAACDPAGDDPRLADALKTAKAVIVQELFLTETAKLADVVLPAEAFSEREGTFTSGERRVQRFFTAVPAWSDSKPDHAITASIAEKTGVELEGESASGVFDKLAETTPTFNGLNYARLEESSEQWPLIGGEDLYYGGTGYKNEAGLGAVLSRMEGTKLPELKTVEFLRPNDKALLAVPINRLYDNGKTVESSVLLVKHIGETCIRISEDTAAIHKLKGGSDVLVTINGNQYQTKVIIDKNVPASVALLPRSMGIPIETPATIQLKAA